LISGADTQLISIPLLLMGVPRTGQITYPVPTITRTFVTTTKPNHSGIGLNATADFLTEPDTYTLVYTPDPDNLPPINILTGWILEGRTWSDAAGRIWEVIEKYVYKYQIGV
jgi:hypothetical protein